MGYWQVKYDLYHFSFLHIGETAHDGMMNTVLSCRILKAESFLTLYILKGRNKEKRFSKALVVMFSTLYDH